MAYGRASGADQQVGAADGRGNVRDGDGTVRQDIWTLLGFGAIAQAREHRSGEWPCPGRDRVRTARLNCAGQTERPVVHDVAKKATVQQAASVSYKGEVSEVANVVFGRAHFRTDVAWVPGLGGAVKVLGRRKRMRPGIARLELEVVR